MPPTPPERGRFSYSPLVGTKRSPTARADAFTLSCVIGSVLVVIVAAVLVWEVGGLRDTPRWWRDAVALGGGSERTATELENRVSSALTRVRPRGGEDWEVAISQHDINAWLAHRLKAQVEANIGEGVWPERVETVRVHLDGDGALIGARLRHSHGATVVWARMDVSVDGSGRLEARVDRAYVGTTRVPVSWVAHELTPGRLGRGVLDLGDGREVLVRGVRAGEGRLELALRTREEPGG